MPSIEAPRTDIPVLLPCHVDPRWLAGDVCRVQALAGQAADALGPLGRPVQVTVVEDACLAEELAPFDPWERTMAGMAAIADRGKTWLVNCMLAGQDVPRGSAGRDVLETPQGTLRAIWP
jgi:hypothetical protein